MTTTPDAPPATQLCACRLPPPTDRRAIRHRARLSLAEVARRVGVDTMTVSRWERGVHEPQTRHVAAYAALLEVLTGAPVAPYGPPALQEECT